MRALEIGHGGTPAEELLAPPYQFYVGVDSEVMHRALASVGKFDGDTASLFHEWVLNLVSRGVEVAEVELYRNDIIDFSRLYSGPLFDMVYMANVLGDAFNIRRAGHVGRLSEIMGASSVLMADSESRLKVVEVFTPPPVGEVVVAAQNLGLTVRSLVEGEDYWRGPGRLYEDLDIRGMIEEKAKSAGYEEANPFVVEFSPA